MNYTVVVAEDEELLLNNLVHKIEKADPDFHVIGTAQCTGTGSRRKAEPGCGIYRYPDAGHGWYHSSH